MIWSPEEDARLSATVAAYGSSWVDVAASVPGRHNDQCRERWIEQVNPSINRSPWSEEEDKNLLDYVRERENASWKEISECLRTGRTETMVTWHFFAILWPSKHYFPSAVPDIQAYRRVRTLSG